MSNFLISIVKSLFRSEVRHRVNNARQWECDECFEVKTHRAHKYKIDGKNCCTRCKRKLVG